MAQSLKISREDAVSLLNSVGLFTKPNHTNEQITERLVKMAGLDEDTRPEDDKELELFEQVKEAVDASIDIEVHGEPTKVPKQKAQKSGKNGKAKAAAKDDEVKRDRFGFREGTAAAQFNTAMTSKPQSMREIMDKAQLKGTNYEHANKMVKEGHFIKEDGKYRLAEPKASKVKKAKAKV